MRTIHETKPVLQVIQAYFDDKGLVRQQLDSFNEFINTTIQEVRLYPCLLFSLWQTCWVVRILRHSTVTYGNATDRGRSPTPRAEARSTEHSWTECLPFEQVSVIDQ